MKKIGIFALIIAIFACCFATHVNFRYAFATENTKEYLIPSNYLIESDYQTKYNISSEEVSSARPINKEESKIFTGSSIKPESLDDSSFEKIFHTNGVQVDNSKSIFAYIYFSYPTTHDMVISVSDGTNSLSWEFARTDLAKELESENKNIKYGWLLFELPVAAATKNGLVSQINQLGIKYGSSATEDTFANVIIYAPYVDESQNDVAKVAEKQNYYNISYNLGSKTYYTGDKYKVNDAKGMLKYANIGEVDTLSQATTYKLMLSVIRLADYNTKNIEITSSSISYDFALSGSYEFRIIATKDNVQEFAQTIGTIVVEDFVPIYIDFGLNDMNIGQNLNYDIILNSSAMQIRNIKTSGVNNNVVDCTLKDNSLSLTAKNRGKFSVTISCEYTLDGDVYKNYSITYNAQVHGKSNGVNWWLVGGAGVVTVVGGIIIFVIMRKKRLLANHYPKY